MKITADDGTPFDTVEECLAYEERLPLRKLLAEVEEAVANDADFADKIEKIGTSLARARIAAGNLKRQRKAKDDPAPATAPYKKLAENEAA